jgi:5-methylcytosine-specific restriction endonuclease McrA
VGAVDAVNRWKISASLQKEVLARDTHCVYCGVAFTVPALTHGARASWEHIVNDASVVTLQNIVRCCMSCNASKGTLDLRAWLRSAYCKRKGITEGTVAEVVRNALARLVAYSPSK